MTMALTMITTSTVIPKTMSMMMMTTAATVARGNDVGYDGIVQGWHDVWLQQG